MSRRARWAGQFYPARPAALQAEVDGLVSSWPGERGRPWALLVPHAGYLYSGRTAAAAYALVRGLAYERVILIGPGHHRAVDGFALSLRDPWETPLGSVSTDLSAARRLLAAAPDAFRHDDLALDLEHSLEVQIPFIQRCLPAARLLPLLMGSASGEQRQRARACLQEIRRDDDLWIVSSDLSHFHSRQEAERLDSEAERLIGQGGPGPFAKALVAGRIEACGAGPIMLLMEESEARGARMEVLDRSDSAAASGDEACVVGYLAAAVWE